MGSVGGGCFFLDSLVLSGGSAVAGGPKIVPLWGLAADRWLGLSLRTVGLSSFTSLAGAVV